MFPISDTADTTNRFYFVYHNKIFLNYGVLFLGTQKTITAFIGTMSIQVIIPL